MARKNAAIVLVQATTVAGRKPGRWWLSGGEVWVSCPECGHVHTLDHLADAGGIIVVSLKCPGGCGWEAWVSISGFARSMHRYD